MLLITSESVLIRNVEDLISHDTNVSDFANFRELIDSDSRKRVDQRNARDDVFGGEMGGPHAVRRQPPHNASLLKRRVSQIGWEGMDNTTM